MKFKLLSAGVLAAGLVAAATVGASAGPHINAAIATTGGPVQTSVETAFQTNNNVGKTVVDINRAVATSIRCTDCLAVAVAVQIDLASGPVLAIHATNKAIATQNRVVNTETCAAAYQFVISPGETTSFSASGLSAIATVKAQVNAAARSGAGCEAIQVSVGEQMDALLNTLTSPGSYNGGAVNPLARGAGVNVTRYVDTQTA